jgi:acetolactate synthase-1/2/3 large subunit
LGKGALPEHHTFSLGDSNSKQGSMAYGSHDLLLAIGTRFVQVDTRWPWFTPPRRLIHIDADAREIGRCFPTEVGIAADPRLAMEALHRELEADPGDRSGWTDAHPWLKVDSDHREQVPILAALQRALPPDALVSFDVCVPGFHSRKDWIARQPNAYFYPGVYVGMGFGLPVGIGAQLARPDCPVCVVSGDGGFQMTMAELGTAAQHGIPVIVVVVNDAGLTLIRRVQDRDFGGRRCEVDLANPDFAALAQAYGIAAEQVHSVEDLERAVGAAVERRAVSLIEFVCPPA